jgi:hypothetical protein
LEPSVERSERRGESAVELGEGCHDRREVGGRWWWSIAADERRKRCLELLKSSREELGKLRSLGLRSQHLLMKVLLSQPLLRKVLLTRRCRRRARRGGDVVGAFDLRDRDQAASGGTGRTAAGAAAADHGDVKSMRE